MQEEKLKLGAVEIENITQRTVSIIGRKGMGKSQTLKMLAYSAPLEIPCYVFDPLGKIWIDGFQTISITKNIKPEKLTELPKIINKLKEKKIIFSFKNLLQSEIVAFSDAFFSGWHPSNSLIFVDEVQEFAPERGMGSDYSTEFERAVRHWRNENDGFIIATQRPAFTSKKVLGLTDFLILYAITWNQDKKVIDELLSDMLQEDERQKLLTSIQTKGFLQGYTVDFR